MSTNSNAIIPKTDDPICQGDIYKNVRYNYVDNDDGDTVRIMELEFPYAVIISQACDVIAMEQMFANKSGKVTKYMPSVLLCPIYDKALAKSGEHIKDILAELSIQVDDETTYKTDDYKVAERDWHYRFHALTVSVGNEIVLQNDIIDFKHYFTLPMSYLVAHKKDRILHLNDLFAEQLTLKYCTFLSRVAIP